MTPARWASAAAAAWLGLALTPAGAASTAKAPPWFEEAASRLGITFDHRNGMSGKFFLPEVMGPGVALFDADADGDLDILFVQGGSFETAAPAVDGHRLYRNRLREDGALAFEDVTAASGLVGCGYGMGATAGDYDGDGRVDLYVTCVGQDQLWHNEGAGESGSPRFREVAAAAGLGGDDRWGVSAAFVDYDRDGRLDLFVGNYLKFDPATYRPCRSRVGTPDWCGPVPGDAVPSRLLRNLGDGRFADVTAAAGLLATFGPALGVVAADLAGDDRVDIYVANDETPNQLWVQQPDGTFRDEALFAGCAVSGEGQPQASMGIDAGDYDGDGDLDLVMDNLRGEGTTLYRNEGEGLFTDVSAASGIRAASLPWTGFGAAWIDADGDGWLDLLTVNGDVRSVPDQVSADEPLPLRQPKQLLRNLGDGRFADASAAAGEAFAALEVSRGAAFGDLDDDGDVDVVVANVDGPARALLGRAAPAGPWLGLRLLTAAGGDALGALVTVERAGAPAMLRRAHADGSYASSNDPRVTVALGAAPVTRVVVRWPSGRREVFPAPPVNRYMTLSEGGGSPP